MSGMLGFPTQFYAQGKTEREKIAALSIFLNGTKDAEYSYVQHPDEGGAHR